MIDFIIPTWSEDNWLAVQLLEKLRSLYPGSTIVVLSDGEATQSLYAAAQEYNATLALGARLKPGKGTGWSERLLFEMLARTTAPIVVKIEPDVHLERALTVPDEFEICARTRTDKEGRGRIYITGPCMMFRRNVIQRIIDLGIRQDGKLNFIYQGSRGCFLEELHSSDRYFNHAIEALNLQVVDLPDAAISWLDPPQYPERYAISHPRLDSLHLLGQSCAFPRQGDGKPSPIINSSADTYWHLRKK